MSTREMQLISRVIRTGELPRILEWGVTSDDFVTNEGRAMFNGILGYYSMPDSLGSVIGEHSARLSYPNFQPCDDHSMTTDALCAEVRKNRLRIDLTLANQRIESLAAIDPMKAAAEMQNVSNHILRLGASKGNDVRIQSSYINIMQNYNLRKSGVDMSAMSWPWEPLQSVTGGLDHEDYVILYGRPKSMKTWVLASIIAWAYHNNKSMLLYTKEMTADNIFQRSIACMLSLPYHEFRMGLLSGEQENDLAVFGQMIESENVVCLSGQDAPEGGDTVPWLKSKVEHYKPDIIFVDGMYLMSDVKNAKKDHERVMNISRGIRQMVLEIKKPVIATIQANRKAAGHERAEFDEIAFSDAIGQDATIAARVINDKNSSTISLVIGGSREFNLSGFRMNGVPATDFTFHSMLTDKEIEKAKEQDSDGDEEVKETSKTTTGKKRGAKKPTESNALVQATRRVTSRL